MRSLCFTLALGFLIFGVSVSAQDGGSFICIQSESGNGLLVFNSSTGAYKFVRCSDGVAFSGTGQVKTDGCLIILGDERATHSVSASVNACVQQGKAQVEVFKDFSPDGVTTVPAMNEILGDTNLSDNSCSCDASIKGGTRSASAPNQIKGSDPGYIGPPVPDGGSKEIIVKSDGGEAFIVFNARTGDYKFVRCDGIAFSGTGQIKNDGCFTMLEDNRENFSVFVAVNVCTQAGKISINVFKAFTTSDGTVVPVMSAGYGDSNTADSTASCG